MTAVTLLTGELFPILIGGIVIAAVLYCVRICADEAPGVSGILPGVQQGARARPKPVSLKAEDETR
jgi:hypothetical protein